jgi:hypothetical protein
MESPPARCRLQNQAVLIGIPNIISIRTARELSQLSREQMQQKLHTGRQSFAAAQVERSPHRPSIAQEMMHGADWRGSAYEGDMAREGIPELNASFSGLEW